MKTEGEVKQITATKLKQYNSVCTRESGIRGRKWGEQKARDGWASKSNVKVYVSIPALRRKAILLYNVYSGIGYKIETISDKDKAFFRPVNWDSISAIIFFHKAARDLVAQCLHSNLDKCYPQFIQSKGFVFIKFS